MGYFGWKPYVPVAERRKKAEKVAAKLQKRGDTLAPVIGGRGSIAKTFWGKAWCENLERYSDYDNRLSRGRTYVRNGSVIDLKITDGSVQAQVMGSSLYKVKVNVAAVPDRQWQAISADCAGTVASLVELLQGRLSKAVMERICTANTGLFPAPKEISFTCSCPDWASMCKHVAAVLYGIGVRLDSQPDLLFSLRRVDAKDLVAQAGTSLPKSKKIATTTKVLDASLLADVFDIEMADASQPVEHGKLTEKMEKLPSVKKPLSIKNSAIAKKAVVPKKPATLKNQVSLKKTATAKMIAKAQITTAPKADAGTVKVKSKSVVPKRKSITVKKT